MKIFGCVTDIVGPDFQARYKILLNCHPALHGMAKVACLMTMNGERQVEEVGHPAEWENMAAPPKEEKEG